MDKYIIRGGKPLTGEVTISGAKNAAIAIIPAAIMSDGICRIENVPHISDITAIIQIMQEMGVEVREVNSSTIEIDPRPIRTHVVSAELARHIRGSYYLLGVLLGRFSKAVVAMPGGCNFGLRPIDQHLKGFSALGCTCTLERGMVHASAEQLTGASIYMDNVSVGATINCILAAVKAKGMTQIENAAREPHIVDLANFLNSMGADIRGAGTDVIKIFGVEHLHGTEYSIIPDQIEAGTYMAAAVATRGDVLVKNVTPKHLESITAKLEEMGATVEEFDEAVRVRCPHRPKPCNVKTMPHPGFPTDMQPQIAVVMATADGTSNINESIWDSRFQYIDELRRMGAQVEVSRSIATIRGVESLQGTTVRATDLRAGAAMVIAGLCAEGITEVEEIRHIERGYEDMVSKLQNLGAELERAHAGGPGSPYIAD